MTYRRLLGRRALPGAPRRHPVLHDAGEPVVGRAQVAHDELLHCGPEALERDHRLAARADRARAGGAGRVVDDDDAGHHAPVGDVVGDVEALREGRGEVRAVRPAARVHELGAPVAEDGPPQRPRDVYGRDGARDGDRLAVHDLAREELLLQCAHRVRVEPLVRLAVLLPEVRRGVQGELHLDIERDHRARGQVTPNPTPPRTLRASRVCRRRILFSIETQ